MRMEMHHNHEDKGDHFIIKLRRSSLALGTSELIALWACLISYFYFYLLSHYLGGRPKKNNVFFLYLSQMWSGGVADSQTRSKPLKKNQIAPKIAFFDPNFTFRFPKSHKNPGVSGWVNTFGKDLPKKTFFLYLP